MEKTIDRHTLLSRTLWGVDIYAHILRKFYPDETVIKVTGRDCGICRNPFAGGGRTLHIRFAKNDPTAKLCDETAFHHDDTGTIPDGDALDFAALYYRQTGQELLMTLNREMHLNLDGSHNQYGKPALESISKGPRFSFFKAPITNTKSYKSITILDAYNYIIGPYAKTQTEHLRRIQDKKRARNYKAANFAYVTFCGEFDVRANDKIKSISGLLCLDFDHIPQLEVIFEKLFQDKYFETALLFRSPSGDGLKWVIEIHRKELSHSDYFRAVSRHITSAYGIEPDQSGKDILRPCFLPYDPNAYINENYL